MTGLRKAGRSGVAVELDGEQWRTLPAEVVLACGLRPGLDLDRGRLRRLRTELRRAEALAVAARLLSRRDVSAARLEADLARRRVAPSQRRDALRVLGRAGAVDDRRLAAGRAETLADRGWGDEAIRWRLAEMGLSDEHVEEAVGGLDPEYDRARRVVEREGISARTARLLFRRGFGADSVEGVCPVVADGR